ncbi:MAG: 1-(5-phosphoribosyl)-5-[(5-phosphoribosylamino)methylideneamino]imidazole-4-carboxamide isomerase [Bacteroidota bacterium]|jgi:phosphoribosylformimino-5-aminoimidazole carboxamide ribotide isomerase
MTIIPAMDLIDGRCVRLQQGDFERCKVYADDPLSVAQVFEAAGFRRLHLVDLDGARQGAPVHLPVLEKICRHTRLEVDFSGGLQAADDLRRATEAGAALLALGSIVVRDTDRFLEWLDLYGPDRLLPGLDVRHRQLAVRGWTEQTEVGLFDLLDRLVRHGVAQVFCTDILRDGNLDGPALDLYRDILDRFPGLALVASGGVRNPDDARRLAALGCSGTIVGKALYEDMDRLDRWR